MKQHARTHEDKHLSDTARNSRTLVFRARDFHPLHNAAAYAWRMHAAAAEDRNMNQQNEPTHDAPTSDDAAEHGSHQSSHEADSDADADADTSADTDADCDADAQLLSALAAADQAITDLLEAHGWTLRQFVAWCRRDDHRAVLHAMASVEDMRAQILISRLRASVAVQLAAIACRDERDEIARKACVNLLEMKLPIVTHDECADEDADARSGQLKDHADGRASDMSAADVQRVLESIGAQRRDG